MPSSRWLFGFVLTSALSSMVWLPVSGQSVVSVHSGLLHFSDGVVLLDDQPIQQQPGKFPDIHEGSELRTQIGRAEILLTPGVFLRVGERSEIRMLSNRFRDTRVQFLHGSAVVEAVSLSPDTAVTMVYPDSIYGDFQVRILKPGRYRFDSNPPEFRAYAGEAEVVLGARTVPVKEGRLLPFSPVLISDRIGNNPTDALDGWSDARSQAIAAGNVQSANAADLASVVDSWQNDPDLLSAYGLGSGYGLGAYGVGPYGSMPGYSNSLGYSSGLGYYPFGYPAFGIAPIGFWGFGVPGYLPLYRYNVNPYARLPGLGTGLGSYPGSPLRLGYRPLTTTYHPATLTPMPARIGGVGGGVRGGVGHVGGGHR